jgi:crotonobetainyl-CoA:carnitine CoA-transferase CaiB-like acyl-CoA transferase
MIAPYETFVTADGVVFVAGANDNLFASLMRALDRTDLIDDPRFVTNTDRVGHREELTALLRPIFLKRTAVEWEAHLQMHKVPCSRVRSVGDIVRDEQMAALDLLLPLPHPTIPDLRLVDLPMTRDGVRSEVHHGPPRLGEHTDDVLAELGYDTDAIGGLRRRGVVG